MELDHVFLRAGAGAPQAERLREFGLAEGSGNTHPGQGTANRRFFFRNAFIELLWVADEGEIASDRTRPTRLAERLDAAAETGAGAWPDGASPFGICFRPAAAQAAAPFPAWRYAPDYLPAGMAIEIGLDTPLAEPMWFFLAQATAPERFPAGRRQPLEHPAGLREITSVRLVVPGRPAWSEAARAAVASGKVSLVEGDEHLMEIGFDGEMAGLAHDFRPALPLVFRY